MSRNLLIAACLLPSLSAGATEWVRYDPECDATPTFACGDFGDYLLGTTTPPAGCVALAGGDDDPAGYQPLFSATFQPYPVTPPPYGPPIQTLHDETPWLVQIDFDDDHGWSTAALVGEASGLEVQFNRLEDPALGQSVTDVHVLASLCEVLDPVDAGAAPAPSGLNMSFGRLPVPAEALLDPGCDDPTFACQIAAVTGEIRDRGTVLTAAAGNHGLTLFPAKLPDVIAVGMVDLQTMIHPVPAVATWETPDGTAALAPGGALCVEDDWAAPAGSSYSSALLAGWLAAARDAIPEFQPYAAVSFAPRWSESLSCWALGNGTRALRFCSAAIDALFDSLDGSGVSACWNSSPSQLAVTSTYAGETVEPQVISYAQWAAGALSPTPEGESCLPCVGVLAANGSGTDLTIDMSESGPLKPGVQLVGVYLKTKTFFADLGLDAQFPAIAGGTLDSLTLTGYPWSTPVTSQPSLWLELRSPGGTLYWTSTSIMVR